MRSPRRVSVCRLAAFGLGLAPALAGVTPALSVAVASALVLSPALAPQSPTLSAQQPTPVSGEATCADCVITLDTIATIGGWEDAGLHVITPFSQVAVDRRGRILVTHLSYPEISVFSREGEFLGTVGRGGSADGEYEAIAHVNVGARYIHVFEFQRGRTVLDHDFEVVRTDRSIPQVLSSVVSDTDDVAFALHVPEGTGVAHQRLVLDMMGRTVSFGGADPVRRGPQMQRFVVAGNEATFWAVRQQANRVVRWDLEPSPAVARVFDRAVEPFERDNPSTRSWPRSLNVGAMLDEAGLWIAWQTPDPEWTERISPGDPIPEVPWQTVLDGWLDLVDPSTGQTIARYQGDDALLGFAHGSGYLVSYHEPRAGGAYIHLLEPKLMRVSYGSRRVAVPEDDHPKPESHTRVSEEAITMNDQLNPEERDILEKFERGELRRAAGAQSEIEAARIAARSTFRKTRRVNLRVTERDFNLAHARAREEGIPYQTLLSSVIHKYLAGRLTEKR